MFLEGGWQDAEKAKRMMIEAMFSALKADHREGDRAIFESGYGSGAMVIDVDELAAKSLEALSNFVNDVAPNRAG